MTRDKSVFIFYFDNFYRPSSLPNGKPTSESTTDVQCRAAIMSIRDREADSSAPESRPRSPGGAAWHLACSAFFGPARRDSSAIDNLEHERPVPASVLLSNFPQSQRQFPAIPPSRHPALREDAPCSEIPTQSRHLCSGNGGMLTRNCTNNWRM